MTRCQKTRRSFGYNPIVEFGPPPPPELAGPFHLGNQDSCPKGHFCLTHGQTEGHCCPQANQKCPVGEPHPSATCYPQDPTGETITICPQQTHMCVNTAIGQHGQGSSPQCCPRGCSRSMIENNGECLPIVDLGDSCTMDSQCERTNGRCIEGKSVAQCTRYGNRRAKRRARAYLPICGSSTCEWVSEYIWCCKEVSLCACEIKNIW